MFTHHGESRTYAHNLKVAVLLSFVAGFINVVGFLSVQRLTTNVTGHFAFFVEDVFNLKFYESAIFFLFTFFFFLGAFFSNTLVEVALSKNKKNSFVFPVATEIVLITLIALFGELTYINHPNIIAAILLFSMGLQNALVTKISNAVVRTTHLTGLFTDLGIEFSQLFFYKEEEQRKKLKTIIILRMSIITFFFVGGIIGGLLYSKIRFNSLFVPAIILLVGLIFEHIKCLIIKNKL